MAGRVLAAIALAFSAFAFAQPPPAVEYAARFALEVDRRLDVPAADAAGYAQRLDDALAGVAYLTPQFAVLVDRDPLVQALFVFRGTPSRGWSLIGASPASTGLPGAFEYFETPLGVFEHTLANPDFRAEGTRNRHGIRGYGVAGLRVFDFGWVNAPQSWGKRRPGVMRLQMHATDADLLEPLLGTRRSKGCIRIPASLDVFIDRYGLLDADYERAVREGHRLWVLRADRITAPDPGRYLVVVDSRREARPAWSPLPRPGKRR